MFSVPLYASLGRMEHNGDLKPKNRKLGLKWAIISAIVIVATGILALSALSSVMLTALTIVSGFGILSCTLQLGTSIITALIAISLASTAEECIKNAHHHLHHSDCCSFTATPIH